LTLTLTCQKWLMVFPETQSLPTPT